MTTVTIPSGPVPYHLALADLVYQDICNSAHAVYASLTFWNGLAGMLQRGASGQQAMEFLTQLTLRLTQGTALARPAPLRFGSQSPRQTLALAQEALARAASFPIPGAPADARALLLAQIDMAHAMLSAPEGAQ